MSKQIEWTDEVEQKIRERLEEDYKQANDLIVWASKASNPLSHGLEIVKVKKSANTIINFIKKELGV